MEFPRDPRPLLFPCCFQMTGEGPQLFVRVPEFVLDPCTFDGITKGPQKGVTIQSILDQIVLSALPDGLDCLSFVIETGQHNDRNGGPMPPDLLHRSLTLAVRQ